MLLMGPSAVLSMPSFDFHLPPCTEGFLIHLSPLWQLPLWQLPLFPSVAQFPCVYGHPGNPHVLNHMITEGECKESWFNVFSQIFLEQTIHQPLEEDKLEISILKE